MRSTAGVDIEAHNYNYAPVNAHSGWLAANRYLGELIQAPAVATPQLPIQASGNGGSAGCTLSSYLISPAHLSHGIESSYLKVGDI